jgi:hypothetical protein
MDALTQKILKYYYYVIIFPFPLLHLCMKIIHTLQSQKSKPAEIKTILAMLRSACLVATLACVFAGDVNEDLTQKVLDNSVKFVAAERKDMKEMGRLVSKIRMLDSGTSLRRASLPRALRVSVI